MEQQVIVNTVKCDECGKDAPATQQDKCPDWGLELFPRGWGYYGGFTDNIPWIEAKGEELAILCHDCCVRLMRAFPSIARAMGNGGHHPCSDDTPCCEFAWRGTENFAVNYDEVLVRTQHAVLDTTTLKTWWQDDAPRTLV
jgi:hypothetical protein